VKCDDGNACTTKDACRKNGKCDGEKTCACKKDIDCDGKSNNKCIELICENLQCAIDKSKAVVCDDSNDSSCAKNTCDPAQGKCVIKHLAEGQTCDDGNPCTKTSKCKASQCIGSGAVTCNDNNPCTTDSCNPAEGCVFDFKPGACDDGDKCTENDNCDSAGCVGKKKVCDDTVACTSNDCDKATGKCLFQGNNKLCEDNNPCTIDNCDEKKDCSNTPLKGATCDDGDACTKDACEEGKCVVVDYICKCKGAADCDDNNPCTTDACTGGKCENKTARDGTGCDTADKCHAAKSGVCKAGTCTGGKPKDCSKGLGPCVSGSCNPATGNCEKLNKTDGTLCDADKTGCTVDDKCVVGACVKGSAPDCSKLDAPCAKGTCTSTGANTFKCEGKPLAKGTACEDGKFCTVKDSCDAAGKCLSGGVNPCGSAGDQCNTGFCDTKADKCAKKPKENTVNCVDGSFCTVHDKCDGKGVCGSGQARVCPGATCKLGRCDEKGNKCYHVQATGGAVCNDNNACTTVDKCDKAGKCVGTTPKTCPSSPCRLAACESKSGECKLTNASNGAACNDGNACTTVDACSNGICAGSKPKVCGGDACNNGVCNTASGGCEKKPKAGTVKCEDGTACTTGDLCKSGQCVAGKYTCDCKVNTDCDDKNGCTDDVCVSSSGTKRCDNKPKTNAGCNDGKACTTGDKCSNSGVCVGTPKVCNDSKSCTSDYCDTKTGKCVFKPLTGQSCKDSSLCTTNDKCQSDGSCKGTAITCNDGNACTKDACVAATGKCGFTNTSGGCSDGNACTTSDSCSGGKCSGKAKSCSDGNSCTTDKCDTKTGKCGYSNTNEGKYCASGKACLKGKCTCTSSLYKGGDGAQEVFYDAAPTDSGGIIAVGRKNRSGKGYEGYCRGMGDHANHNVGAQHYSNSSNDDQLRDIAKFASGTYLAVGRYYDSGIKDDAGWLLKVGSNCKVFQHKLIKDTNDDQYFEGVASDGNGGAWVVGARKYVEKIKLPFPGGTKTVTHWWGWHLHLDKNLNVVRNSKFQQGKGIKAKKTVMTAVKIDSKKYNISVGYTDWKTPGDRFNGFATYRNTNGEKKWERDYGGKEHDRFLDVAVEGTYAWIAGDSDEFKSSKGSQIWLVKMRLSDGNPTVIKHYGGSTGDTAYGIEVYGGNRVLVGKSDKSGVAYKLSSSGSISKSRTWSVSGGNVLWEGITRRNNGVFVPVGQGYGGSSKAQDFWAAYLGTNLESGCN